MDPRVPHASRRRPATCLDEPSESSTTESTSWVPWRDETQGSDIDSWASLPPPKRGVEVRNHEELTLTTRL